MHPLLASKRYFLALVSFWLALFLIVIELAADLTLYRQGIVGIALLPSLLLLFFMVNASWFICRKQPLSPGRFWKVFLNHLLALLIEVTIWWVSFWFYLLLLEQLLPDFDGQHFVSGIFTLFLFLQVALYLSFVFLHYLLISIQQKAETERLLLSEKLLKVQSELLALRNTIQPHFLFNTLTAISALIASDPFLAQRTIGQLADFLRYSLSFQQEQLVPLQKEIEHFKNYLQVEKIRLGERLSYEIYVSNEAEKFLLLVMSVFPLVENAIKHGVEKRLKGGKIIFQAWTEANQLHIRVENPLPDDDETVREEGIGLAVLQRRLELFYAQRDILIISKQGTNFIAELLLPEKKG